MRQLGPAVLVLIVLSASAGGGVGCTLLLDTSTNPHRCETDDDCAIFPNAACDDAKKQCVPRLPYVDSGAPDMGTGGTSGGLTCEQTFDNQARLNFVGPDGGLRPLPDGGP